jgi:hypothetical protein
MQELQLGLTGPQLEEAQGGAETGKAMVRHWMSTQQSVTNTPTANAVRVPDRVTAPTTRTPPARPRLLTVR